MCRLQEQVKPASAITSQLEEAERASGILGDILFLHLRLVTWVPDGESASSSTCDMCTFLEVYCISIKSFEKA